MADNLIGTVWNTLTGSKKGDNKQEAAIVEVLDLILQSRTAEIAFESVVLSNNMASSYKNTQGKYPANTSEGLVPLYAGIAEINTSVHSAVAVKLLDEALMQPNIAGIPISSAKVETTREIEVSESMVIVQSTKNRKYWTDNAVPRLKEWTIEGYLTSTSPLDTGCLIKPSLQWQAYYLDVCARSRRPVLFKTNRGEFTQVQITSFHTTEEASYNNAIQVSISLKEYNPYTIASTPREDKIATKIMTNVMP